MGWETRNLYTARLRRRRLLKRSFDVFVILAFWAAVIYLIVA